MKFFFLPRLKDIRQLCVTGLAFGWFYFAQLAMVNKKDFLATYDSTRDTTRPGNKSFGLNYGYKTDLAVKFT